MQDESEITGVEALGQEVASREIGRRAFLRAAVTAGMAGAAGLAAGRAVAEDKQPRMGKDAQPRLGKDARKGKDAATVQRLQLTPAEKQKEARRADAQKILKELGGDVEIQWIKKENGSAPLKRRIIQLYG